MTERVLSRLDARAARASRVFDTQGLWYGKFGMGSFGLWFSSLTWQGSALELIRMAEVPIIK